LSFFSSNKAALVSRRDFI